MESANHEKNLEIGLVCQTEWTVTLYGSHTINTVIHPYIQIRNNALDKTFAA